MNQSAFAARLVGWQQGSGRHHLPWQNTRDAYRIWLSEVMLQQTQVSAVIPYFERFVARFGDVFALADAEPDAVMAAWAGLGYYSRARSLHLCARRVAYDLNGKFPDQIDLLEALPGIGRSTAAAIAVFAFGRREAILDGNVKRVLCRVFGIDRPMQSQATQRELVGLAYELLPEHGIEGYTQGLMDFGATLCTPRRPACSRCPFQADCSAYGSDSIARLPRPKARRVMVQRYATLVLFRHRGRVLLQRRAPRGIWGGLWSLPQSPFAEAPQAQHEALAFIAELHGSAELQGITPMARFAHGFTHFKLEAMVYRVELDAALALPEGRFVDALELAELALPQPIRSLFQQFGDESLAASALLPAG